MSIKVSAFDGKGYFGGKESPGTYQTIINEIRPCNTFISLFLGHCAIVRNLELPEKVIGIELSKTTYQAWKKEQFDWIELINTDALDYLRKLISIVISNPNHKYCIYADPPYRLSSRKSSKKVYECEMTDEQHIEFLKLILKLNKFNNVDILISHYPDDLYRKMLSSWRMIEFESTTRQGKATENLYMNYNNPEGLLQDYQFVGANKDERYNLKHRTSNNLIKKLKRMPPKKRQAVIYYLKKNLSELTSQ